MRSSLLRAEPVAAPRRAASGPVRLTRSRRTAVSLIGGGIWGSGMLWLALNYAAPVRGPFGPEPNPFEPWALRVHGLFAFATMALLGLLWAVHIVNGWTSGRRRWSGATLVGLAGFLTLTGYLLYYAGGEQTRALVSVAHWSVGAAAAGIFLWHRPRRHR